MENRIHKKFPWIKKVVEARKKERREKFLANVAVLKEKIKDQMEAKERAEDFLLSPNKVVKFTGRLAVNVILYSIAGLGLFGVVCGIIKLIGL